MNLEDSLGSLSLDRFTEELSGAGPVPGGGSAAAVAGALAAALLTMVARLTLGRERYAGHAAVAAEVESDAERLRSQLLQLADEDASAYAAFVSARRLPHASADERSIRVDRLAEAAAEAVRVPLQTAERATDVVRLARRLAAASNPNAASDVGAAAALAEAAVRAAALNVRINLPSLAPADPLGADARDATGRLLAEARAEREAAEELVEATLHQAATSRP